MHYSAALRNGLDGGGLAAELCEHADALCLGIRVGAVEFLYLAGRPSVAAAREIAHRPRIGSVIVAPSADWKDCLASAGAFAKSTLLEFDVPPKVLDLPPLAEGYASVSIAAVPKASLGYWFGSTVTAATNDWNSQLGRVILDRDRPAAVATILFCGGGLAELAVMTYPADRRLGLARRAVAELLLDMQALGLRARWTAETAASCSLARKAGFAGAKAFSVWKPLGTEACALKRPANS